MIEYFGTDVPRINHALKVFSFASTIAMQERLSENDLQIVQIASILHDIGIKNAEAKYNSSGAKYQEIEGPLVAMELLSEFNLPDNSLERIGFIIGNHHSYDKVNGVDFQILVEADFIVNIDEDNIKPKSIESIRDKYFRTDTGRKIIETMYLRTK
jgi:hypothetical protein